MRTTSTNYLRAKRTLACAGVLAFGSICVLVPAPSCCCVSWDAASPRQCPLPLRRRGIASSTPHNHNYQHRVGAAGGSLRCHTCGTLAGTAAEDSRRRVTELHFKIAFHKTLYVIFRVGCCKRRAFPAAFVRLVVRDQQRIPGAEQLTVILCNLCAQESDW